MALLRDSPDDFLALINATATDISYPTAWVEKDYWITEIIRSLAVPLDNYTLILKGGTSLSKAWKLIQRMSQDVDILLVPPEDSGSAARDSALKAIVQKTGDGIGVKPRRVTSSTGIHRATAIDYPPMFGDPTVPPEVLLEMGVRGGPDPNERKTIRSFVADYAVSKAGARPNDFDELARIEIPCLRPERTLVEKLSALNQLATKITEGEEARIGTSMRHYYDIAMLLDASEVRKALQGGVVAKIAADVEIRSRKAGWPCTPRPDGGFAESPAFTDDFLSRRDVRAAYALVLELVVGGPRPDLDNVRADVRAVADLL